MADLARTNREVAISLAEAGLAVFPCGMDKRPPKDFHWREESSADPKRTATRWLTNGGALVALDLAKAGLIVIDADRHGDGPDGVAALKAIVGDDLEELDCPVIETAGGGLHLIFRQPEGESLTNAKGSLPKGIDVRGAGGYIIAPGSTRRDGSGWRPMAGTPELIDAFADGSIPPLPDALLRLIKIKPAPAAGDAPAIVRIGEPIVNRITPAAGPAKTGDFFENVNQSALAHLGAWVTTLFPTARYQDGTGAYRVKSRDLGRALQEDLSIAPNGIVDFGVHDMGDPRQGARTAIDVVIEWGGAPDAKAAAFWLCERLGRPPESMGWGAGDPAMLALGTKIGELYERKASGELVSQDTGEVVESAPVQHREFPVDLTYAPGVLGAMVEYMIDTAMYRSRPVAMATALSVLGMVAGRWWAGPSRSSTVIYSVVIAETGFGKDHYLQCAKAKFLPAAGLAGCLGPGRFMSMSSVYKSIERRPLSLVVMDEVGETLARSFSKKAGTHEQGISTAFLELWSAKFGVVGGSEYAQESAKQYYAPAMNLLGFTTPRSWWESMKEERVLSGFSNRFLVFPTAEEVDPTPPRSSFDEPVPPGIVDGLLRIHAGGNQAPPGSTRIGPELQCTTGIDRPLPRVEVVPWASPEVEALHFEHAKTMRTKPKLVRDFYARTAEYALRIATIYALSENPLAPRVTIEGLRWAMRVAEWSIEAQLFGARQYMASSEAQENANRVLRIVRDLGGKAKRAKIAERLRNHFRPRELNEILEALVESSSLIREVTPQKEGPGAPSVTYVLGPNA